MTHKLTITVFHHSTGESTVSQNSAVPLAARPLPPPETERFATPEEARARAKQLQAEAGGPDIARIDEHLIRPAPRD